MKFWYRYRQASKVKIAKDDGKVIIFANLCGKKKNMKILFVCSRNKRRSRTAENIFRNQQLFSAKSAGFSDKSPVKISEKLIVWADLILLMEHEHAKRLRQVFSDVKLPKMAVLNIKDNYEFMDEQLVNILKEKIQLYVETASREL